jgi:penicillin-insensitive murein endopeptidase
VSKVLTSVALITSLLVASGATSAGSVCFGTVSKGRLEGGVALPSSGPNFTSYSSLAESVGRTYVHSSVRDVVAAAYKALESASPGKVFVFGETGWKEGGQIKPHRTHQNGLSVDFMVPVLNKEGRSVPLPTSPLNKFGYDIEFDRDGRFGDLTIDFEAVASHLRQLDIAANERGLGLALVIFDHSYLKRLLNTSQAPYLKQNLKFMKEKPWVRHDEHYHVDFAISCGPFAG